MKKQSKRLRPYWFKVFKTFLKLIFKKPKFKYLGEEIKERSIILSNHVGMFAPITMELYFDKPFRFWGTYEMNSNIVSVYKYLSYEYFHQKHHWNLFLSRLFCVIAAPVLWVFYRGLNLISTYPDYRFKNSIKDSVKTIKDNTSIIIFPEDSTNGYYDHISKIFGGFILLAKKCYKEGIDLPIYLSYLKKKQRIYIFDKPIMSSELLKLSVDEITEKLCYRLNQLSLIN